MVEKNVNNNRFLSNSKLKLLNVNQDKQVTAKAT